MSAVTLCGPAETIVTVLPLDVIASMFSIAGARIEPVENDYPLTGLVTEVTFSLSNNLLVLCERIC